MKSPTPPPPNDAAGRQGLLYRAFRAYVRLLHDRLLYRHVYRIAPENIPPPGTPTLIVSNHQNCLNDALAVALGFHDRKPHFVVRADVFAFHPLANRFLRKLGLLPAYRLKFEGEEALQKNEELLETSENELLRGATVVMYPEGGHQDKHFLGDFSLAYLKMAFDAAEKSDFQKDILIVPACNHYSDYFELQEDALVWYGKPISIKPYYDLYRSKPRTAQRKVNDVVRQQINDMMLNITDLQHYEAIDFLRCLMGRDFAIDHGFNPDLLPERLLSDKQFTALLQNIITTDLAADNNNVAVVKDAISIRDVFKRLKINASTALHLSARRIPKAIAMTAALVALFPVFLYALPPSVIVYLPPRLLMKRFTDKMFTNSILIAMSVLLTVPLVSLLSFILITVYLNAWIAALYVALLPAVLLFAAYYRRLFKRTLQIFRLIHFF